jgi:regulator of sirC expression with transglutaminase-like and TPR domain
MLQDEEIQLLVVTLHSNLSEMYIQLKQYDKALSEARESLTINPNHTKSKSREQRVLKLKSL